MITMLILGLVVLCILTIFLWYVAIISRRNKVLEALSSVDVQTQMRADLIPNILTIAKRFMAHEMELMTKITELRTNGIYKQIRRNIN